MVLRAGHVGNIGETRNAYTISMGKPLSKRPLVRPHVDNIKLDLTQMCYEDQRSIELTQDREMNTVRSNLSP